MPLMLYDKLVVCLETVVTCAEGLKVLMVDDYMTKVISVLVPQTWLYDRHVIWVQTLDDVVQGALDSPLPIRAIALVVPSEKNIATLCRYFREPYYSSCYLYFSGALTQQQVHRLARADALGMVRCLKEVPLDVVCDSWNLCNQFLGGLPQLWATERTETSVSIGMPDGGESVGDISTERMHTIEDALVQCASVVPCLSIQQFTLLDRMCDGIMSLVSLCTRIGYQSPVDVTWCCDFASSGWLSQLLANRIKALASMEVVEAGEPCLVVIYDRRSDLVSPLLHPWTYAAMVHEYCGLQANIVLDTTSDPITFSPFDDAFIGAREFDHLGELATAVARTVAEYTQTLGPSEDAGWQDIDKAIEMLPSLAAISGHMKKHVNLVHRLGRIIAERRAMNVAILEQAIVNDSAMDKSIDAALRDVPIISALDRRRLALMLALRPTRPSSTAAQAIFRSLVDAEPALEDAILRGRAFRQCLPNSPVISRGFAGLTAVFRYKQQQQSFTQHQPHVASLVDAIITDNTPANYKVKSIFNTGAKAKKPNIVVYAVGGMTREEYRCLMQIGRKHDVSIYCAGSSIMCGVDCLQLVEELLSRL